MVKTVKLENRKLHTYKVGWSHQDYNVCQACKNKQILKKNEPGKENQITSKKQKKNNIINRFDPITEKLYTDHWLILSKSTV